MTDTLRVCKPNTEADEGRGTEFIAKKVYFILDVRHTISV